MKRLLPVALVVTLGCSRAMTPPVTVKAAQEIGPIRKLAVVPAIAAPAMTGDAAAQAPAAVSRMLDDAASRQGAWSLVDGSAVRTALGRLPADSPEARAGAVAQRVGADAALTATIATYRERVGSAYGVTEPAAVSIQMFVVRAGQKHPVWTADYTFTQEPLTYNLLNLWGVRGGPKWHTADELAQFGVDEAVRRLAAAAGPQAPAKAP